MARRPNTLTRGTGHVGALLIGNQSPVLVFRGAGAPVDGTSGTGVGDANPGSRYTDTTNADEYVNIGTKASPVWLLVGGASAIRYATVALTNALLLAARATPITLVAAPGAGYRWQLLEGTINLNLTGAYTETSDNFAVKYDSGSGIAVSQTIESGGLFDTTGKIHSNFLPKIDALATEAQGVNKALVLHNTGDGELGGGNAANVGRITVAVRRVATL